MNTRTQKSSAGFSLVELMVAMALSLVLLAGVLGVLHSSKVTYSENERLARIQENARAAVEMILRDMRSGGFQGCGRPLVAEDFENLLVDPTALTHNFTQPLSGFEVDAGGASDPVGAPTYSPAPVGASDIVVVRGVRSGVPSYRTTVSMVDGNADVVIANPNAVAIPAGKPLMISNCERATVFSAFSFTTVGTTSTIKHEIGGTAGVPNAQKNIGAFLVGSQVSPLNTVAYYVGNNAAGVPSLYRAIDDDAPVELIQGVQRLEIMYGEDTNGDGIANTYVTAADVGNWNRITNASISVLVRSVEEYGTEQANPTFHMVGPLEVSVPADRFVRTVFTSTGTLRNRTP